MQSPIDLPVCVKKNTSNPALDVTWGSQEIDLINNGHAVQTTAKGTTPGKMTVGDSTYTLVQCHWHWGSEHTVGGQQMPLCVHCVHTKDNSFGRYGVLGVLYNVGATANSFLSLIEDQLPSAPAAVGATSKATFKGPVNFTKIYEGLALGEYWTYDGSFTTPPCTEAVDWRVLQNFAMMTTAQLDKFKAKIGWGTASGNYRPAQPLNGRSILGCRETAWYPYSGEAWSSAAAGSNPICTAGHMQSPIDLPVCVQKSTSNPALAVSWGSQEIELTNNGHAVQTTAKGTAPGKMTVGDSTYTLVQCHWHWGSEHTVGGQQMPLCVHCVHTKDSVSGRYGVLGVLYNVGATANSFLSLIEDQLPSAPWTAGRRLHNVSTFKGPVNFDKIYEGLALGEYWTYDGSFTTPPCTEAVEWRVLQNFAMMTKAQLDKFKAKIGWGFAGGNYRPAQPLNGRSILGCTETAWYPYSGEAWSSAAAGSNPICTAGHMQSPINLPVCVKKSTSNPAIAVTWGSQEIELINNGHAVQTTAKGTTPGKMAAGNSTYTLVQCHWHWGSEHTVGGQQMPLCVHCVHTKDRVSGRYGVLGVLYNVGATANSFLSLIEDQLPSAPSTADAKSKSTFIGPVNFDKIYEGLALGEYWAYDGSFTTPPCTEAVDWRVLQNFAMMTKAQLDKFKAKIGWGTASGNYRPAQPLNGRSILGCRETAWYPYSGEAWSSAAAGSNPICTAGHMQSPIDLPVCVKKSTSNPALNVSWGSQEIELTNNGHAVQTTAKGTTRGNMTAGNSNYTLVQCHWHWGSEHTVGGQQMPLCVHCVHTKNNSAGRYGVLGVLYKVGATANSFLSLIEDQLPSAPAAGRRLVDATSKSTFTGPVDFDKIYEGLALGEYWTYDGSFTTPPCTEAVDWRVLQNFATLTHSQLDKFEAKLGLRMAGGNYRPAQPLNGREISGCVRSEWYPYNGSLWSTGVASSHEICSAGHMQSPIDLPECATVDEAMPALSVNWGSLPIELANNGHTVQTTVLERSGKMIVGTSLYTLVQCHWHWGSEHTVSGSQKPLAAHCVHLKDGKPNRYGVLGILYTEGDEQNEFLSKFEDKLPSKVATTASKRRLGEGAVVVKFDGKLDFDAAYSGLSLSRYWTYDGSFTTPPCTEAVDWYVLQDSATASRWQIQTFAAAMGWTSAGGNFRPPQLLNGRTVRGCAVTRAEQMSAKVRGTTTVSVSDAAAYAKNKPFLVLAMRGALSSLLSVPEESIEVTATLQPEGAARRLAALPDLGRTVVLSHVITIPSDAPATVPTATAVANSISALTPQSLGLKVTAMMPAAVGFTILVSVISKPTTDLAPWYPYSAGAWSNSAASANPICSAGQMQSPVDLPTCALKLARPAIATSWGRHEIELINSGHGVQATVSGSAGKMEALFALYTLVQCHWHWGSEHTVALAQKAMVAHCVHTKDGEAGKFGVLGVLYELSETADALLSSFEGSLPAKPSSRRLAESVVTSTFKGPLAFDQIHAGLNLSLYWSYSGSFTTPPCTEAVDWFVLQDYAKISQSQLGKFKTAMGWEQAGGNFRPPQPLNGRVIEGCATVVPWYPYNADAWATSVVAANPVCHDGILQSPIDFPECNTPEIRTPLNVTWGTHKVELKNNGHTVQLDVQGIHGMLKYGAFHYELLQCHFHWGSEHTFAGKQMDLSVHCVHKQSASPSFNAANPRYGVLGFVYEVSETESDPFLALIEDHLPSGSGRRLAEAMNISLFHGPLDFGLLPGPEPVNKYFTYEGSLTTPPCSEVVDWYVAAKPKKVSAEQLRKFKVAIGTTGGNFRPPQELHGRIIEGCEEWTVGGAGRERPGFIALLVMGAALSLSRR